MKKPLATLPQLEENFQRVAQSIMRQEQASVNRIMIASIRAALKNGVKHYDGDRLLTTEEEVLNALAGGARLLLDETDRVAITSMPAELHLLDSSN